jgi:branched-chain amino acid transport system substrate-binding protein
MKPGKFKLSLVSMLVAGSLALAACDAGGGASTPTTVTSAPTNTTVSATNPTAETSPTGMTAGETPAVGMTPATGMTPGASGGVIKIGVDLPVSGGDAAIGIPTRNGMELAIRQANEKGGLTIGGQQYKLEMFFLDDVPPGGQSHDPAQSSKNADAFIADNDVVVVLGPFNSSNARAMMPKLNQAGLCQISPSNTAESLTKPEFGQTGDLRPTGKVTYFRVVTTDDIQGPAAADFAIDKLGLKKVYILDDTETYGKGIADNFEKRFREKGGEVLGHDGVPKGTTDYSAIMTKIASTNPDLLFYGGTSSNNIPLARTQMKSAGLNIPLMGGDGIQDSEYTKVAGPDAEGSYSTVAAVNVESIPEAKQFIEDYKAAFPGQEIGAYSGPGYETAMIAIDAIKRADKKDRAAVCEALRNTKGFKGVLGETTFDANGDTSNKVISFYKVEGGKWTFVEQITFGE